MTVPRALPNSRAISGCDFPCCVYSCTWRYRSARPCVRRSLADRSATDRRAERGRARQSRWRCLLQQGWMPLHEAFETLAGMHEEMKTVGNLPGLGSPSIGRLGIVACAVTTHQAELRVGTKPRLNGGAAPILKQVHDLVGLQVGLQIDDHRPRGLARAKGTIVDPNRAR